MLRNIIMSLFLFVCTDGNIEWRHVITFVKYEWSYIDYEFPNETARQQAIDEKLYVTNAPVPIDFQYHYNENVGGRRFITTPRLAPGVPATIGYLPNDDTTNIHNPSIIPYPNWEMNKINGNCDHIISVHRIQIDECNRLWIVDTGINENLAICPPKILIYNLLTDQLIRIHKLDMKKLLSGTKLTTTIVEVYNNTCDTTYAYIADPERYQMIVYDYTSDSSTVARNRYFYPNPNYGLLEINNTEYIIMSGISGMALGLPDKCQNRNLFFHTSASAEEVYISSGLLRWHAREHPYVDWTYKTSSIQASQSTSMAINKNGIIFFISLSDSTLKCWHTNPVGLSDNTDTIYHVAHVEREFPTSLQIETHDNGTEYLYGLFVTPQAMFYGTVDPDAYPNFRIMKWEVKDLIRTTRCDIYHPFDVQPQMLPQIRQNNL